MPQSLAARPRAPLIRNSRKLEANGPALCGPPFETKLAPLDLVAAVDDNGTFEGYASLFNREDLGRDIILPGAFRTSLARRGSQGIRMLYQHDPAQPIGVWLSIGEDARGLRVKGRLVPDVARAREILALMRSGALDGLSIGYRAVKATRDAKTGIRRLSEIDLWEISIVTFPMLPDARVARVKRSLSPPPRVSGSPPLHCSPPPCGEGSGVGVRESPHKGGSAATTDARLAAAIARAALRLRSSLTPSP